jgi:hypothetical protein
MSDEIINKVADALENKFKSIVEQPSEQSFEETKVCLPNRSVWIGYAKVAIEAIREPTQDMISAGIDVGGELGWGCYYSNYKNLWQAMIDKVLNG